MKRYITAALVLAATLTSVLPSFALGSPSDSQSVASAPETSKVYGHIEHGNARLNLSDDQLEKLHAVRMQYSVATSAKKAELKSLKSQEFEALSKPTVDRDGLMALQSQINGLQADLGTARINMMADASNIFSAEQKQEMRHRYLTHGFHGRHHHGSGHGRGMHGGSEHRSATT